MSDPLSKMPDGVRYYFGAEARLRRAVEDAAMSVFAGWSYEEIATPALDYFALFDRGMGHGEAQRAFRFTDTDGRLLALRPDVTSSVARASATLFATRPRPLRLCYAASVFRQRPRSHAEWRREWTQLGCELIGAAGAAADLETLLITVEVLEQLGLAGRFRITLNHVEIFNGLAAQLALDAAAREEMRRIIDTRDTDALDRFLAARAQSAQTNAAHHPLTRFTGQSDLIAAARQQLTDARSTSALDALAEVWRVLEALQLTDCFEIDLGDVSGLDYYTGLVYKIYVAGAGTRVGSGGRYDELTANFGGREPAVGFVLDLDALTDVLARSHSTLALNGQTQPTIIDDDDTAARFRTARLRRAEGERIDLRDE
ncbi:MAG TPA: ATP phosphoribosyltransferase regulatory subunit [Pyrinomonadaceae bacterium]|nr:ATP phosphoribosyltransferase regulatory subunit [Pyrinomonadaceae bacterium]